MLSDDQWRAYVARVDGAKAAECLPHLASYPVSVERAGRLVTAVPNEVRPEFAGKVVVFLHGGGMVLNGGPLVDYWTAVEAMRLGCVHVGVDYWMPPDHPFPVPVEDARAAYLDVVDRYGADNVAVFGVSSGGTLAAVTLQSGVPMPACLMLDGPWLDLTCSGPSYAYDPDAAGFCRRTALLYAGGAPLTDPRVSPMKGAIEGFPPAFLMMSQRDTMLSETAELHDRLQAAGVPSQLHIIPGARHAGFGGNADADWDAREARYRFLSRWCD